jgi:hypothetical protein
MGQKDDSHAELADAGTHAGQQQDKVAAVPVCDPPPMIIVAIIGTIDAARTADSQLALPVTSRTPNASATGAIELPAAEIDQPAKNHRNEDDRSGRPDASAVPDTDCTSGWDEAW